MRKPLLALAAGLGALWLAGSPPAIAGVPAAASPADPFQSEEAPAPQLIFGRDVTDEGSLFEQAQFFWGGQNYCWYYNGWRGPGYYWCGYAWRRGYGWGGPVGWNGWRWHRGGPSGFRGGPGGHFGGGPGGHFGGGPGDHFGGGPGHGFGGGHMAGPMGGGHEGAPGGGEHGGGHGGGGHEHH